MEHLRRLGLIVFPMNRSDVVEDCWEIEKFDGESVEGLWKLVGFDQFSMRVLQCFVIFRHFQEEFPQVPLQFQQSLTIHIEF
jgi:hypothetical protein